MASELFLLPPDASKRLIAKGVVNAGPVRSALEQGVLVVVAGSTNGYVARELLGDGFPRRDFLRGYLGPKAERGRFPGDVVMRAGSWDEGKTIFDVAADLGPQDVILKGANALDYARGQAAVLVAHPKGGTALVAMEAVVGRRVGLLVPVGLEKMVCGDLPQVSRRLNAPGRTGLRLLPLPGSVFTEIEALGTLADVSAELIAAGGIDGWEGAVLLNVEGDAEAMAAAGQLIVACGGRAGG
jgi:hypothetical protein